RTLRTSDLIRFRVGSATPWLHVTGKGNRDREIPLPAEVQRTLMAWLEVRPQETQDNSAADPAAFSALHTKLLARYLERQRLMVTARAPAWAAAAAA
ncbi:MAG: hypothetical protein LC790_01650, partial [Actinobacteria bacterium]|nr:hypothetical protein [Actinomycetota bacterium]